ncbi:MAG: hypothetical protein N838_29060 [Thiohalocapsa sp. PB-PSB1]|nr:MAG: hypothetical protein N838_29060 [Thiohalocapsa sp. PB-PSB1]
MGGCLQLGHGQRDHPLLIKAKLKKLTGVLNWMYPDSLHVHAPIWQASDC